MAHAASDPAPLRVVLFSGGRGSGALATTLVRTPGVSLTVAINGYDDGASTGEVRRFLGDALGPSDFRKNASRLAIELGTAPGGLAELLERRLPAGADRTAVTLLADSLTDNSVEGAGGPHRTDAAVRARLQRFLEELDAGQPFRFDDCSVGNLVFAGAYLMAARQFNAAVDDYVGLLGLPPGLIVNVTDGSNAHLVALDLDGQVLGREADIVDANRHNRIRDIYLLDRALAPAACAALAREGGAGAAAALEARSLHPPINPRLADALARADLIVYAPGTQHSSLFPSYLTAGLTDAIVANPRAIKLLVTNIQTDAEIAGSSAVDIIERAVYYLKDKGRRALPTPALVTHYLVNDPSTSAAGDTYVPLGRLDSLQDPRLVRLGDYEQGGTGRHDAAKVLGPYVSAVLARRRERRRIAVVLTDAGTGDSLAQTMLEMVRGGIADQAADVTVFCETDAPVDPALLAQLPFAVRHIGPLDRPAEDARLKATIAKDAFEYIVVFESSGMYDGEDVPWLISHLTGRLDSVWGSRRLSVRDIEESLRLKYRKRALLAAMSAAGSHALSLLYLLLYGRYVSDTLSGARAVRLVDLCELGVGLTDRRVNQHLLSGLLRRKAEMFEVPVHFYSISPARVRRTTVLDGVAAIGTIIWQRLRPARRRRTEAVSLGEQSANL